MTLNLALFLAFALLQIGDAYSTLRFLKHGIKEGNPVMVWLMDKLDPFPALGLTKIVIIFAAYETMGSPYWTEAVGALCVFYTVVVIRNLKVVK